MRETEPLLLCPFVITFYFALHYIRTCDLFEPLPSTLCVVSLFLSSSLLVSFILLRVSLLLLSSLDELTHLFFRFFSGFTFSLLFRHNPRSSFFLLKSTLPPLQATNLYTTKQSASFFFYNFQYYFSYFLPFTFSVEEKKRKTNFLPLLCRVFLFDFTSILSLVQIHTHTH